MAARNVVVLGRTGDGKSTLCRCLASCLDISPEAAQVFRESSGVISHTHDPVSCSADGNPGTGAPGTKVTDTPGLMDTNGVEKDEENISKIVRYVRALISVNAFCLVVNEQADRFDSGMQDAVKLLVDSFGPTCMNNMGIVFTKAYGVISSEISRTRTAQIAELITKRTGFSVSYIPSWQIDCKPEEIATTFGLPQSEIAKCTTKRDDTLKEVLHWAWGNNSINTTGATVAEYEQRRLAREVEEKRQEAEEKRAYDKKVIKTDIEKRTIEYNRTSVPIIQNVQRPRQIWDGTVGKWLGQMKTVYWTEQVHVGNTVTIFKREEQRTVETLGSGKVVYGDWTTVREWQERQESLQSEHPDQGPSDVHNSELQDSSTAPLQDDGDGGDGSDDGGGNDGDDDLELFKKKLSSILANYNDITFKELRIIKLIFYGTPRAGKTTLCKQLLQNIDTLEQSSGILQPSTNIVKLCDPIFVERTVMTNEESNTWRWTVQKLDDIAKTLLQCLDNKRLQFENKNIDLEEAPVDENRIESLAPCSPVTDDHPYLDNDKEQNADTPGINEEPTQIRKDSRSDSLPSSLHVPTETVAVVDVKQLFFEAVKTGQWAEVMSTLNIDKAMLVQVIDGGGQPSFQEIFPLLISGPSVTLLMFKLTDELQNPYPVHYQPSVGEERTWQDTYVVRDFIFHAISSVVPVIHNPFGCKMLLVGTHKDQLEGFEDQRKRKITSIAKSLHSWLHELKAFKSLHVRNFEEFIISIDNLNQQDVLKIKKKIEELLSQAAPRDTPAPWLVFDFILHAYAKSEKIRKVEKIKSKEIAKLCGVKDDDFEVVLQYLHYEAGTLLYYSDIPELNNWVITDFQLIFDSISQIIIEYFNYKSEHGPHMQDKDLLHEKGLLEASVLKDVEGCLKVNELLSLMQHRHIVSKMDEKTFFMPSVLPKADTKISSNSCSFIVMFESGFCPIGLFCAATTRLIIMQKWKLTRGDLQFRNKISFYCKCSGQSYQIIFSAFFAYYEVCLMGNGNEIKSNVRFAVYKAIEEVFTKVCKDMKYPSPSYGFYCPRSTCKYRDITYPQNEHPAKCTFDVEAQEMTCYYSDAPSHLTEEHKSWFVQVQPQEQISGLMECGDSGAKNGVGAVDRKGSEGDKGSAGGGGAGGGDVFINVSEHPLGDDDIMDVKEEVMDMAPKWMPLGMALRLIPAELDMISSTDRVECLTNMLRAWLQQRYDTKRFGQPSWRLLCQAIHKPAGGNNPGLAKKIAERHLQN